MDKVKIMRKMDKDGLLLCDLQGNAFELSIQLTSTSSEIFMRRFMNSKVAKMIDNESKKYLYERLYRGVVESTV